MFLICLLSSFIELILCINANLKLQLLGYEIIDHTELIMKMYSLKYQFRIYDSPDAFWRNIETIIVSSPSVKTSSREKSHVL